MDGVISIIAAAREAGLVLKTRGNTLHIAGPKAAGDLARRLLARKFDVLRMLDREARARSFGLALPPPGEPYIVRTTDPDRPHTDKCMVVEPGTAQPAEAWAWRAVDGDRWFRFGEGNDV